MALPTFIEIANSLDPDGSVASVATMLDQNNEMLQDFAVKESNEISGEQVTIEAGLPTHNLRALNQGVEPSYGTNVQVHEGTAIAEQWLEIDVDVAKLNGNSQAYRMQQAGRHIEAMNQGVMNSLIYGNPATDPKDILGLMQRYNDTSAGNAQNIVDGGGTTGNQTSMWLIHHGFDSTYAIYPKGTMAGLVHEDLGIQVSWDAGGQALRMRVYQEMFQWKFGLVVKNWQGTVRIPNLDVANLASVTGTQASGVTTNLLHSMLIAYNRVPTSIKATSRGAFYCNPTVKTALMRIALDKSASALSIQDSATQLGGTTKQLMFLDYPIRMCDAILNTETAI